MSKDLYLIRHALASEKEQGQDDIDRFLASDGVQGATKIGYHFNKEGVKPDIIITSPAVRAHSTSILIAEQLNYNTESIHINDELYEASVRILLQVVNRLKASWNTVFIIGHNPSMSYLAEYITRAEIGTIEPAGYVHIQIKMDDWEQVSEGNGEFVVYKDPSNFGF